MTSSGRTFEGGRSLFLSLLLLKEKAEHWGGSWAPACASLIIYSYIYTDTSVILFLFCILVTSFISTHEFYFASLILSPILLGRGGVLSDCMVLSHLLG